MKTAILTCVLHTKRVEVKSFCSVVKKRSEVQGSEKWGVMCSEEKWLFVVKCFIIDIYSYVAECSFCAIRCVIIIYISMLFSN